jgi:hypothetical protein
MQAKCAQYLGTTFKRILEVISHLVKFVFKKKLEIFLEIYFFATLL